jgi:hypothetical protein
MPQVHTFSLFTDLSDDTRIPIQYLGGSNSPAPRQFELSTLLTWIEANLTLPASPVTVESATINSGTTSIAVAAGKLVAKVIVVGSASGTFDMGTSGSGNEILDNENYDTNGAVYAIDQYFHTSGALHFSGYGSDTLTVKLVLINLL